MPRGKKRNRNHPRNTGLTQGERAAQEERRLQQDENDDWQAQRDDVKRRSATNQRTPFWGPRFNNQQLSGRDRLAQMAMGAIKGLNKQTSTESTDADDERAMDSHWLDQRAAVKRQSELAHEHAEERYLLDDENFVERLQTSRQEAVARERLQNEMEVAERELIVKELVQQTINGAIHTIQQRVDVQEEHAKGAAEIRRQEAQAAMHLKNASGDYKLRATLPAASYAKAPKKAVTVPGEQPAYVRENTERLARFAAKATKDTGTGPENKLDVGPQEASKAVTDGFFSSISKHSNAAKEKEDASTQDEQDTRSSWNPTRMLW